MSYNIHLKVTDGTAVVTGQTGTVPDGLFTIAGHQDGHHETLSVSKQAGQFDQALSTSLAVPVAPTPTPAPTV